MREPGCFLAHASWGVKKETPSEGRRAGDTIPGGVDIANLGGGFPDRQASLDIEEGLE